jgi:hypothetical protein
MRHGLLAPLLAAALVAGPALAEDRPGADAAYDSAFVSAFEKACVPGRLSFEATKAQAAAEGWTAVPDDDHPELAALMATARQAAIDPEYPDWSTDFAIYRNAILGAPAYLVVTYVLAPDVINMIGCHLYDFEQTRMIDAEIVTALIGNPISNTVDDQGLVSYVWGPPCAMPRTFDTYLTLIKPDSPHLETTGFSGLTLKFETSEPAPGEDVPTTYC